MFAGKIPEFGGAASVDVVVVDDGPAEADEFVLVEDGFDGARGALGAGAVERRDPKLQCVETGLAGFGREILRGVGPREFLDPRLRAPGEAPVRADEGREDMVVLRVDAVEGKIGVDGGERVFVRILAVDERAPEA